METPIIGETKDFQARVGLFVDGVRKLCDEHGVDMQACINKYGPQIEFVDRKANDQVSE